ncbi:MAG: hypothetical protein HDT32_05015 [Clostridiales bacterium]|nr:hypothetical protein [Clostridiales bacterium]
MSKQQRPKKRPTLIKFGVPKNIYVAGQGNTIEYELISHVVGTDGDGKAIQSDCFYCEWLNSYGAVAIQQQADGVSQSARIRMTYVKAVYDALKKDSIRIYKHGIIDDEHCFVLSSSPDNYAESNKMLEFNVKHYEVK